MPIITSDPGRTEELCRRVSELQITLSTLSEKLVASAPPTEALEELEEAFSGFEKFLESVSLEEKEGGAKRKKK